QQELAGEVGAAEWEGGREAGANRPQGGKEFSAGGLDGDAFELHRIAAPALGEPCDIGADHIAQLRISPGRLPVGHEHDGPAVARYLDGAKGDSVRDAIEALSLFHRRPLQAIAHAIAAGGELVAAGKKSPDARR